jgi:fatty acid desaturase
MPQNLGTSDRDIRLVLTAVFGLIALFAPSGGVWQVVPALLALAMLTTAAVGFCPLYAVFDISTNKEKSAVEKQ